MKSSAAEMLYIEHPAPASHEEYYRVSDGYVAALRSAGFADRTPNEDSGWEKGMTSRFRRGEAWVDLSVMHVDGPLQVKLTRIPTPPPRGLPAKTPWDGASLRSFEGDLECANGAFPWRFSADGKVEVVDFDSGDALWSGRWTNDGGTVSVSGSPRGAAKEPADPFPPCVEARVWTSGHTIEIWCRDEVRECELGGARPQAWVLMKDGGAGSDAVALVGSAAADVFGGRPRIVAEGTAQSEGIEVRHQVIARGRARVRFDWGSDTVAITPVEPDHFERTAYAIAGAIERELDVPQVRVIADPGAEAPIVIVVGGAVKAF